MSSTKDSNTEYLRLVMQVLQNRYVLGLTTFVGESPKFIQWHRKNGMSGGGGRFVFSESLSLASGSINFSQVQDKKLKITIGKQNLADNNYFKNFYNKILIFFYKVEITCCIYIFR